MLFNLKWGKVTLKNISGTQWTIPRDFEGIWKWLVKMQREVLSQSNQLLLPNARGLQVL